MVFIFALGESLVMVVVRVKFTLPMLTDALKLSGIELSEDDRKQMVENANRNLTSLEELRKIQVDVKGEKAAPLYQHLTSKEAYAADAGPVKWNFEKFLVSRDGKVHHMEFERGDKTSDLKVIGTRSKGKHNKRIEITQVVPPTNA